MDGRKPTPNHKVAILWRGDAQARRDATPQNNRFFRIFEELEAVGIRAEPAVYAEEFEDEVREQLLAADGVLVWVDPFHQGKTRPALDALLRDVAAHGPWVSAHPDVIMKMGVKEVCIAPSIWAGARTRIFIAAPPSSTRLSRLSYDHRDRASSNRTEAMAGRAYGRSS